MSQAPLSIASVALTVTDLESVRRFYEDVIGLTTLRSGSGTAVLGVGTRALVELNEDRTARRSTPREAGLFHTAFLLPRRSDLADWIGFAAKSNIQLQGASDHLVSEAVYLADPEGNGIEIYIDRPATAWQWRDGSVVMATERLDIESLMAEASASGWAGAPDGTIVGHVHLQVGALDAAQAFYQGTLGLDITTHYPGATFFSTGGYHHHLATNIWNSRGAVVRSQPATGLREVRLAATPAAFAEMAQRLPSAANDALRVVDPWGTALAITRA